MKIWEIIYYVFFAMAVMIALLLIISIFPIRGNYQILAVQSGSMEPGIKTGGLVVVKPSPTYKIGDIITFALDQKKIAATHRINDIRLEAGKPIYTTKGDANNAPDQREVLPKEIIGRVIFSLPFLGYLLNVVKTPFGFMLIIVIPGIIIIYDEIKKIKKEFIQLKKQKIINLDEAKSAAKNSKPKVKKAQRRLQVKSKKEARQKTGEKTV